MVTVRRSALIIINTLSLADWYIAWSEEGVRRVTLHRVHPNLNLSPEGENLQTAASQSGT